MSKSQVASGLSHIAIRARDILESIWYYTGTLGLPEAFRMHADDGSLATVYFFWLPDSTWSFLPAFDLFISA